MSFIFNHFQKIYISKKSTFWFQITKILEITKCLQNISLRAFGRSGYCDHQRRRCRFFLFLYWEASAGAVVSWAPAPTPRSVLRARAKLCSGNSVRAQRLTSTVPNSSWRTAKVPTQLNRWGVSSSACRHLGQIGSTTWPSVSLVILCR